MSGWQIFAVVVIAVLAFGSGWVVALVMMRENTGEISYQEDRDRL